MTGDDVVAARLTAHLDKVQAELDARADPYRDAAALHLDLVELHRRIRIAQLAVEDKIACRCGGNGHFRCARCYLLAVLAGDL